jgi:hypothetical protein
MKKVYYNPNLYPVAVPDGQALTYAERLLELDELTTSNYLVLLAVRVLVKKGLLDHANLEIHFNDHVLTVDKDGGNLDHPKGLGDEMDEFCAEIYGL